MCGLGSPLPTPLTRCLVSNLLEAQDTSAASRRRPSMIHGAVDISSLPTWITNSIRTPEMEGVTQHLPDLSQDYALCLPNLERIIIGTYVVDIDLAWRASPDETPATDYVTITQNYFNSRQSPKGKPLRMPGNAGYEMESIPERVRKITGTSTPLLADGRHPTIEMTVYFVDKSSPTDWCDSGFIATYNITSRTITSASPRYFYRNNLRDMPESTNPSEHRTKYCYCPRDEDGNYQDSLRIHNNWSNPKSWLPFRLYQTNDLLKHWEKMTIRNLEDRQSVCPYEPGEYEAALARVPIVRNGLKARLNQRRWI